jgi:hypothetical protein
MRSTMKSNKFKNLAIVAAFTLAAFGPAAKAQQTNFMVYNFNTGLVAGWGNWFGGYFQSVAWDATNDATNNPSSGSMKLLLNCTGSDQYVLWDTPTPSYSPLPWTSPVDAANSVTWTNLSFDMRYDVSSAIRTNGNGSLDFGLMRVGSRSPGFAQDWFQNFAIPATNGLGQPNTNWVRISLDLRQIPINFSDLSAGMVDIIIGMDGGNFNPGLIGPQTIWFDNIQFVGTVAPLPPPQLAIQKAIPAMRMFGGSGIYGRSQVSLVDLQDGWISGASPVTYPVVYSFTLLDNATRPGNLDTHIQFIPRDWDATAYEGNSGADYYAANELWLRILSGTGNNTACLADISWKTNAPFSNPGHTDLLITNSVRAGTWTLTFNSATAGTLTAPGASPVPFNLSLSLQDATNNFNGVTGTNGIHGMGIRFGNANNGNIAWGGVPDDWARISVSGPAGTNFAANFTVASNSQVDTNIFDLANSDGASLQIVVPTNAPYWITWTTPDTGFEIINGASIPVGGLQNWNATANVTSVLEGGLKWGLVPRASLVPGNANFFAMIKRVFSQLQVLLPGETNAPGTLTGKVGTPIPVSLINDGGLSYVTVNAVDSAFHIVNVSGDVITLTNTDNSSVWLDPGPLVNGTATGQVQFGSTGNFTVTVTDTTNTNIPTATSSAITVGP